LFTSLEGNAIVAALLILLTTTVVLRILIVVLLVLSLIILLVATSITLVVLIATTLITLLLILLTTTLILTALFLTLTTEVEAGERKDYLAAVVALFVLPLILGQATFNDNLLALLEILQYVVGCLAIYNTVKEACLLFLSISSRICDREINYGCLTFCLSPLRILS